MCNNFSPSAYGAWDFFSIIELSIECVYRDRKVTLSGSAEGGETNGTEKERVNCRKRTAK